MKKGQFTEEQIVYALRQAEAGTAVADICRKLGVSENTFYRWKRKFAGLGIAGSRRLAAGGGEPQAEAAGRRPEPGQAHAPGGAAKKLVSYPRGAPRPSGMKMAAASAIVAVVWGHRQVGYCLVHQARREFDRGVARHHRLWPCGKHATESLDLVTPAPHIGVASIAGRGSMEVLYRCCCGLDVHKDTVVACLIEPGADGPRRKTLRTFGTMTDDLLALADWLRAAGCAQVAMESTGVYWKPVYNLLEGQVAVMVVNAQHIKAVPGRKTDLKDAEWIADLLQHGLLRASFIPDRPQRELRDLTRTRTTLIDERSAAINRLHKVLEDANIKLAGVATDVMGVSGRAILAALLDGTTDPATLAELARGSCARSGRNWRGRSAGGSATTTACC